MRKWIFPFNKDRMCSTKMKIVDQTCGIENSVKNQHKYEKVGMKNEISLMRKTKGTNEK